MSKKVIAYFMHEYEEGKLQSTPKENAVWTDGYVFCDMDEAAIELLRSEQIIVQDLETENDDEQIAELRDKAVVRSLQPTRNWLVVSQYLQEGLLAESAENERVFQVELIGPLLDKWQQQLAAMSAEILEKIGRSQYLISANGEQARQMQSLPFVRKVKPYLDPHQWTALFSDEIVIDGARGYNIRLHDERMLPGFIQDLEARRIRVESRTGTVVTVTVPDSAAEMISKLALDLRVAQIEAVRKRVLHNDKIRQLVGIDSSATGTATVTYTGAGETVAVADTGVDDKHPDIATRISGRSAWGRKATNDTSDPHGHGTHVIGTILGDGTASQGAVKGIAVSAKAYVQSLLENNGELLSGFNLASLLDEAYTAGARIHNNSWGDSASSRYTTDCFQLDEYVWKKKDMLVVFAAGNSGNCAANVHAPSGFVDWMSVHSPATSKNCLSVGASRSNRNSGGKATDNHIKHWPSAFPDAPISQDLISGNKEQISGISSRGPCDDGRIKPDLVAPGTDVVSCRSSAAPVTNTVFWGSHGIPEYAYSGGTSMAAAVVSGCAAVVREYYQKSRNFEPSAALTKATLLNSGKWLTGSDAVADNSIAPNYHQGFGCVDLTQAIPNALHPWMQLEFSDNWQNFPKQFGATGEMQRFEFELDDDQELRICLAYTDFPGRGLQNNLNLMVDDGSKKWLGNEGRKSLFKIPDPDNSVEVVRIPSAKQGRYRIQVTATTILRPRQDFALVVTGAIRPGSWI